MTCIDKGILRSKLDGELREDEIKQVDTHLAVCARCRRELEEMASDAAGVRHAMEALAPHAGEADLDPALSLARFRARHEAAELTSAQLTSAQNGGGWQIFGRRWAPAWGAALGAAVIAASLSFAPVRSWGQRMLAMLRVEKIEVVSVDPVLPAPAVSNHAAKMLGQLISDNVVVTRAPGKAQPAADAAEASTLAGFTVRALAGRADSPHWMVEGEQAFHLALNRERLQAIVDEVGRSDIQLPASIDGAEVAVHIPKAVVATYGNVPSPIGGSAESEGSLSGVPPADLSNALILAQVPSPTVSVPPNLNIAQVAEAGLEIAGLSPQEAQNFVQSVDWTSTLVIPVPRQGGSYQKEQVDGVQGTLISVPQQGRRPAGYTLIWIRDGIIYSLAGFGDSTNAVALADSLTDN